MKTKRCNQCGREHPADRNHFFPSNSHDGLTHVCKECNEVSFETQLPFKEQPTKICNKCNRELPRDDAHYGRNKNRKDGRLGVCRECQGGVFEVWNHRFVPNARDGYKYCNKCNQELPASKVFFDENTSISDGLAGTCRKCKGYITPIRKKRSQPAADGYKECYDCRRRLPTSEFSTVSRNKDGLSHICKGCQSKRYQKNYKKKIARRNKKWYGKNKQRVLDRNREYYRKRSKDPKYRAVKNLRSRMRAAIIDGRYSKSVMELLGGDREVVLKHIESQFKKGMSWDNYGVHGWHIDHIRPCNSFDLSDPQQLKECFHYTNLQPLWAKDNIRKGDKLRVE
jgi:protein-arginine kinase activator protein McsA